MEYTTRNTDNRLARKQLNLTCDQARRPFFFFAAVKLNLNHVVPKGAINLYIEVEKHKNVSRQKYSLLEVKLRRLQRKTFEDKYDIRDKILHTVLANSSNHSRSLRKCIMQGSKLFK